MKKMTMILFSIVLILLSGCARLKVEENNTLIEYLDNKYGKAEKGGYEKNNIKCDVLKDNDILYINGSIFILKDGTSYEYIKQGNKFYKNNQQCKKKETDIIIQKVVGDYFIGKDDKVYSSLYTKGDYNIESDFELLIKNNDIVSLKRAYEPSPNGYMFFVLKTDGNIYKTVFDRGLDDKIDFDKVVHETLLYSKDAYGLIKNFFIYGDDFFLITDNALYGPEKIVTEECTKYADVDCEIKMVENKLYKNYKSEIKYINENYIVLKDNTILWTKLVFPPLEDEEV